MGSSKDYSEQTIKGKYILCRISKPYIDTLYKYKCGCGRVAISNIYNIKKSEYCYECRIIRKPIWIKKGEAGLRRLYSNYKDTANRRGLEFKLSLKEFNLLTKSNCYYCNSRPKSLMKRQHQLEDKKLRNIGDYTYNGLDRVNNKKGYTKSNSVSCCVICNKAKLDLTLYKFKKHISKIYDHWISK
jgi:hypothetical protein